MDDIIQDNRPCVDYYYDVSGALTRTDYRNGSVYYTYDNAMQVTKVKNKWNTTDISEYNYTYDTTGNVKTKSDGTTLTTYTYGLGNRLMSSTDRVTTGTDENGAEVYEETIIDYTYDLDGNLTVKDITYPESYEHPFTASGVESTLSSISTFEQNYTYDSNNRLTEMSELIVGTPEGNVSRTLYINSTTYTYDNNGNTLTEAFDSNKMDGYSKAFTYNKRNQLTGYSKDNVAVASYTYYADGLRRSKTVGSETTRFYYDRGNIVAEGDGSNITAQNVFGVQGIIKRTVGTDTTHYFKDAHGDTKQIVDGTTGTVTQSYEYDAYGNESDPTATDTNPFRYCGEYYDDETGYIYLRNRYYEPSTQRFITEDTHWNIENMIYGDTEGKTRIHNPSAMIQASNLYAYCMGNPVMYVDVTGALATEASVFVASAALIALGKAIKIVAGICTIVAINTLNDSLVEELKNSASYSSAKTSSQYINWDKDSNGINHVLNGSKDSKDSHGPIWKKFNIDPNNNGDWEKLLPILQQVVELGNEFKRISVYEHSNVIGYNLYYAKQYLDKGVEVIVKLYVNLKGDVWFSDAWGKFLQ